MGRKCGEKTSRLICISSSREHFCVMRSTLNHPKDAGVPLSFPDLGLLPDVEVFLTLGNIQLFTVLLLKLGWRHRSTYLKNATGMYLER